MLKYVIRPCSWIDIPVVLQKPHTLAQQERLDTWLCKLCSVTSMLRSQRPQRDQTPDQKGSNVQAATSQTLHQQWFENHICNLQDEPRKDNVFEFLGTEFPQGQCWSNEHAVPCDLLPLSSSGSAISLQNVPCHPSNPEMLFLWPHRNLCTLITPSRAGAEPGV